MEISDDKDGNATLQSDKHLQVLPQLLSNNEISVHVPSRVRVLCLDLSWPFFALASGAYVLLDGIERSKRRGVA